MDLHGVDIVIPTLLGVEESLKVAVQAIEGVWPNAVVDISELMGVDVYSSGATEVAWSAYGWNERYAKDLVTLLADSGHLTVVVEDKDDPTLARIVDRIREGLKH